MRKDPDDLKSSQMTQKAIMGGVIGEIWGCQISVSNKIKASGLKYTSHIVKPTEILITSELKLQEMNTMRFIFWTRAKQLN